MKAVSIRELHHRTGAMVRAASRYGEIRVTDNGRIVAKIMPASLNATDPIQPSACPAWQNCDRNPPLHEPPIGRRGSAALPCAGRAELPLGPIILCLFRPP